MSVILASASPRRREILKNLGVSFRVVKPDVDEHSDIREPGRLTCELARRKAEAVKAVAGDSNLIAVGDSDLIIACDTVVYLDGEILGKPRDEKDAARMLAKLSGRTHEVVSGICLSLGGRQASAHETTRVTFEEMSGADIEKCVRLGSPCDKAGGYAVQGIASLWISKIEGDYFNVVGLPVCLLRRLLYREFGRTLV